MKVKVYLIDKEDKPVFCGVFSEKQKARESDFIFIDRVLKEHEEDLFQWCEKNNIPIYGHI